MATKLSCVAYLIVCTLIILICGSGCKPTINHDMLFNDFFENNVVAEAAPIRVDSVKIFLNRNLVLTLYPTVPGHVEAIDIASKGVTPLTADYSIQTMSYIDSIFIKKNAPVVTSRKWHIWVTESQSMDISLILYSDGARYKRNLRYPRDDLNYDYEYSCTFLRLITNMFRIRHL